LFDELKRAVQQTPTRQIRRLPYHINDPEFARALVEAYLEVARLAASQSAPTPSTS